MVTPRQVSPDRDIEGLICEDHARDICPHKPPDDGGVGREAPYMSAAQRPCSSEADTRMDFAIGSS
jgi:hypothetical protein